VSVTPAPAPPAAVAQALPDAMGQLILGQLPKKLEDLERDTLRITKLADGDTEESRTQLRAEIGRTVMAWMTENIEDLMSFGTAVLQFRNWAAFAHGEHASHIDDHHDRIAVLEAVMLGGDSTLSADDAELFNSVAIDAEYFATESLKVTSDPEGRAKLEEMIARARRAQERIDEVEVDEDDDDDGDEGDEGDDTVSGLTPTPTG
jgi:hypothetical protein